MSHRDHGDENDDFWPSDGSSIQSSSDGLDGRDYVLMGLRDEATDSEGSQGGYSSENESGDPKERSSDGEDSLKEEQGTVVDDELDESSASSQKSMLGTDQQSTKGKIFLETGPDVQPAGRDN